MRRNVLLPAVILLAGGTVHQVLSEEQPVPSTPVPSRAVPAPLSPTGEKSEFKIRTDVQLVLLDVSVKNSDGGFVSGLKQDAFKVYENKVPQDLTVFQAQDVPVTVGLVVDNSGSVRPKKHEVVTAALTFVKESHPQDETFVVNFNDQVIKGLPAGVDFTDDRTLLRNALMLSPARGRTSLYDGIKTALEHLEKGHLDKKTLIVISDGGDNMSETTEDQIVQLIRESLATIYTIGIYSPEDDDKNPGFLKKIAEISGGEYHHRPSNIGELTATAQKIAQDIRNRYTLGYSPSNTNFDGKVRKLRVFAADPKTGKRLDVRSRSQYVAEVHESSSRGDK